MFKGLALSLRTEKCSVLTPNVDGSVPLFDAGLSSARRNPVCMFVAEGAKIEASESVTSRGMLVVPSNCKIKCQCHLNACQEVERRTRDRVMFGNTMILLQVRSKR